MVRFYDFLTDAYPSSSFTNALHYIKTDSEQSINTIIKCLSDYIGLNGMGENELALNPAYFQIKESIVSGIGTVTNYSCSVNHLF